MQEFPWHTSGVFILSSIGWIANVWPEGGRQVVCWVVWPDREHKLRLSAHINSAAAAAAGSITSPLYVIDGNLTHATTEGDKQ